MYGHMWGHEVRHMYGHVYGLMYGPVWTCVWTCGELMCQHVCGHMYGHVHGHACGRRYGMCLDMCTDIVWPSGWTHVRTCVWAQHEPGEGMLAGGHMYVGAGRGQLDLPGLELAVIRSSDPEAGILKIKECWPQGPTVKI